LFKLQSPSLLFVAQLEPKLCHFSFPIVVSLVMLNVTSDVEMGTPFVSLKFTRKVHELPTFNGIIVPMMGLFVGLLLSFLQ
jgi:hypothetical protein